MGNRPTQTSHHEITRDVDRQRRHAWNTKSLIAAWLVLAGFAMSSTGCQSLRDRTDSLTNATRDMLTWNRKHGLKNREKPEKILAIWSESVVYGANQEPTRGLGGRIYLFNRSHQPVKSDGELVVYAFDDNQSEGQQVEA